MRAPAWSPDGKWIAFTVGDEIKWGTYNMERLAVVPCRRLRPRQRWSKRPPISTVAFPHPGLQPTASRSWFLSRTISRSTLCVFPWLVERWNACWLRPSSPTRKLSEVVAPPSFRTAIPGRRRSTRWGKRQASAASPIATMRWSVNWRSRPRRPSAFRARMVRKFMGCSPNPSAMWKDRKSLCCCAFMAARTRRIPTSSTPNSSGWRRTGTRCFR